MRIFRKYEKIKPKIIVIFHVDSCCIMVIPEHVDEMKKKLHKEFGIVEGFQLSKLLGLQYEWKIFESGESYVVTSMSDKAE